MGVRSGNEPQRATGPVWTWLQRGADAARLVAGVMKAAYYAVRIWLL
ncbi:hypothetical protein JOF35_008854 [Streptomyces demainii]|uniref:Uncharacterized protein n=1 Tax=Streptomyces demainii TaxID=588122 RepID=A0ABT9L707_9ACTN|nr:hypothetical protein [Streptomyces demainii]